jgi:hypothetical protein
MLRFGTDAIRWGRGAPPNPTPFRVRVGLYKLQGAVLPPELGLRLPTLRGSGLRKLRPGFHQHRDTPTVKTQMVTVVGRKSPERAWLGTVRGFFFVNLNVLVVLVTVAPLSAVCWIR